MTLIRTSPRRTSVAFALITIALLILASACGSDADVASVEGGDTLDAGDVEALLDEVETDGDAATVDDETLTGADVADLVETPDAGVIDKVAAADAITDWVRNELWYSALAEAGLTEVQPYLDDAKTEFEDFVATNPDADVPPIDSAAGRELIRSVALGPAVVDYLLDIEEIELVWPERLCSSHILVETEEEAVEVIARLDAGEDFATLAMELSIDPGGATGGDLGCVDPATFVPEFVAGATALGGPGLTPPVQSEFGFHVIDVRSFDATPSEDPAEIQNLVLSTAEFTAFQQEVLTRAVTIDARYGVWDEATGSVVPADG